MEKAYFFYFFSGDLGKHLESNGLLVYLHFSYGETAILAADLVVSPGIHVWIHVFQFVYPPVIKDGSGQFPH